MTALFLKYRPQTFTDLIGQETVRKTLQNALKSEKPSHAYLFAGSRGTGKTSTARIFAKGLSCKNLKEGNPCGTCEFCVDIARGNLIDVIEIDAASNRGIDEIRDLREKINFAPNRTKRKIYIIDEVHMLTKEAFNALLKTLEEPPDHAFFCLATTETHKIPETILSRCQVFQFERFSLDQLINRLKKICKDESFSVKGNALSLISKKAEGGLRDAISLLEQIAAETENNITEEAVRESLGISSIETLENFYQAIIDKDTKVCLDILKNLSKKGGDFRTFGHDFLGFLRERMFQNLKTIELPIILTSIEEIEKALFRLKNSPILELPLEIAIINLTTTSNIPLEAKPQITSSTPVIKKEVSVPPSKPKIEDKKTETSLNDFVFKDKEEKKSPIIEEKSIEKTENTSSLPLSAQNISDKMNEIVQNAEIAIFAKKSFLTTIPEVNENNITFYTDSEFHKEKLSSNEVLLKIKKAITQLFGQVVEISFVKKRRLPTFETNTSLKTKDEEVSVDDFLSF
ncbi:DNA polymerase III subunit gamma/tau [Candidatus Gracilibacteria bacterium]|nr:DNA polymerase III subunit gamma/tau [Candidatus Gracilibacteria bacterium]